MWNYNKYKTKTIISFYNVFDRIAKIDRELDQKILSILNPSVTLMWQESSTILDLQDVRTTKDTTHVTMGVTEIEGPDKINHQRLDLDTKGYKLKIFKKGKTNIYPSKDKVIVHPLRIDLNDDVTANEYLL